MSFHRGGRVLSLRPSGRPAFFTKMITCARIVAVLCLVVFAGCDSADSDPENEKLCSDEPVSGVLQPLETGNWWIYEERNQSVVLDSIRHEVTGTVSDPAIPGGQGHVIRRSFVSDPSIFDDRIWINTPSGYSMIGVVTPDDTLLVDFVTYPYPASQGETFYAYSYFSPADGRTDPFLSDSTLYEVVSTDEVFMTGAGTFSTTVIKYLSDPAGGALGDYYFQHFLPGVGFVGQERYAFGDEDRMADPRLTQRLVSLCIQ